MVIVTIIVVLLLLILTWILFGWVILTIDTDRQHYSLKAFGVCTVSITSEDRILHLRITLPFFQKRIDLERLMLERGVTPKKKPAAPQKDKKKKKAGYFLSRKLRKRIIPLLKSFKVRHFFMNIDTDDPVLNAKLYPFAFFARRWGMPVYFNFQGRQCVQLEVRNRLVNILWALIH
ncbi:MAG: hypothetical protein HKN87_12180 [Saprospiraceae bacterium]|nr:hypothetical protein [Saprospiraceae bacterium]